MFGFARFACDGMAVFFGHLRDAGDMTRDCAACDLLLLDRIRDFLHAPVRFHHCLVCLGKGNGDMLHHLVADFERLGSLADGLFDRFGLLVERSGHLVDFAGRAG